MEIEVIRSHRKTMALELKPNKLLVRAPVQATRKDIEAFLQDNQGWIRKNMPKVLAQQQAVASVKKLTMDELHRLADLALRVIPERVSYYAPLVGVSYGRITIRNQRSKWGSCSSKGNLNFNCLLMLAPVEVLDSVIVHELCHRKEMNHSPRFYAEVLRVFPDYHKWNHWLKTNGPLLMARMTD
ncbi:MAG: M48 family metallopeptidase [Oscillospiraceae bacterium]|nr:M48 family metallopeptidase [Oscillospiraceae bacterium]